MALPLKVGHQNLGHPEIHWLIIMFQFPGPQFGHILLLVEYCNYLSQWIGLRENLNRKPWFLPSNIGVSG